MLSLVFKTGLISNNDYVNIDFEKESISQLETDKISDDSDFQKAVDYFKKYQKNDALFYLKKFFHQVLTPLM